VAQTAAAVAREAAAEDQAGEVVEAVVLGAVQAAAGAVLEAEEAVQAAAVLGAGAGPAGQRNELHAHPLHGRVARHLANLSAGIAPGTLHLIQSRERSPGV
jgi:hypothetical protein